MSVGVPDGGLVVVFANGTVIDGTGRAPKRADVVVRGDRIEVVGRVDPPSAATIVDIAGLVVAPGIIDLHTHSDVSLLSDPGCVSAIGQGITTQVVGHCGFSAFPTDAATRASLTAEEPVFGFPRTDGDDAPWGWDGVGDYLGAVAGAQPATNVATLVGHNTLRRLVAGSMAGPLDADRRDRMVALAEDALSDGAIGVSTGLSYAPGIFADADELVAVAAVAGRAGRRYHTHMRYGDLGTRGSLEEAIATARRADTSLNVSHLYPGRADQSGEVDHLLGMVDAANRDGIEVTFDLTLFRRGGGAWVQGLAEWVREGGVDATRRRLADPAIRERIREEVRAHTEGNDWDDELIVKVSGPATSHLVGRSIGAIAVGMGVDPEEAALRLVEQDGQFWVAPTIKRQEDLDVLIAHPACIPVTDGMAAHPDLHGDLGLMPKTFGTFPLLFGDYVRRRGVLTLPEAIAKVTDRAARRLGLADRGRVEAGAHADLLVFDPATIANRATDDRPGLAPTGVVHVMVNGGWALRDGSPTGRRTGRVIT